MQTQVKTQAFFSEKQTLYLKQFLGAIVASEGHFLSAKKYLLDKDELTFDEALTVFVTLEHSYYGGCFRNELTDIAARQLVSAINLLSDALQEKYLLTPLGN